MSYATADEIVDAIRRANLSADGEWQSNLDGTYRIIPSWIGSVRVFMAERIQEAEGYEVAYQSALGGTDLNLVGQGERWGYWEDGGIVYLDRTVHIVAPGGVALDVARLYAQEAIFDWSNGACIPTTDPATGLDRTPALINLDQD